MSNIGFEFPSPLTKESLRFPRKTCDDNLLKGIIVLATGIQTGMSRTRQNSSIAGSPSKKCYLQILLFAVALIGLWFFHSQAHGVERVLGLSHGQFVETANHQFYVFDNLEQSSAERLTESLKESEWDTTQALNAHGYGVKRILLLFALCYTVVFLATKSLVSVSLARFKPRRPKIKRSHWRYSLFLLGAYAQSQNLPNFVPLLFTFCGVVLVLKLGRANPSAKTIAKSLGVLSWVRLYWAGSLVHLLFFEKVSRHTPMSLVVGLFGLGLALLTIRANYAPEKWAGYPGDQARLNEECRFSYKLGSFDFLSSFAVIFAASQFQYGIASVVVALAPYTWGAFAYSLLLRAVLKGKPADPDMGRAASPMRIAASVWLLAPIPFWELFVYGGSLACLMWLSALLPMVLAGRPWGSSFRKNTESLRDTLPESKSTRSFKPEELYPGVKNLHKLSGIRSTSIIFMSLPPEVAASLFNELTFAEVQAITLEISQLPSIPQTLRDEVCSQFAYRLNGDLMGDWMKEMVASVRARPNQAALALKRFYLPNLGGVETNLTPKQKAAVLFMSLPPEMSAQLFSELGPEEVQAITLEITQLPRIAPEVRASVINEFLHSGGSNGRIQPPYVGTVMMPRREGPRPPVAGMPAPPKPVIASPAEQKPRRPERKKYICAKCGDDFNHGIGLRKHQRQTGHKGSEVFSFEDWQARQEAGRE